MPQASYLATETLIYTYVTSKSLLPSTWRRNRMLARTLVEWTNT